MDARQTMPGHEQMCQKMCRMMMCMCGDVPIPIGAVL